MYFIKHGKITNRGVRVSVFVAIGDIFIGDIGARLHTWISKLAGIYPCLLDEFPVNIHNGF